MGLFIYLKIQLLFFFCLLLDQFPILGSWTKRPCRRMFDEPGYFIRECSLPISFPSEQAAVHYAYPEWTLQAFGCWAGKCQPSYLPFPRVKNKVDTRRLNNHALGSHFGSNYSWTSQLIRLDMPALPWGHLKDILSAADRTLYAVNTIQHIFFEGWVCSSVVQHLSSVYFRFSSKYHKKWVQKQHVIQPVVSVRRKCSGPRASGSCL